MKKYKVTLSKEEHEALNAISSKDRLKTKNVLYSLHLVAFDEGPHQQERSINETISRVLNISIKIIDRIKKQFVEQGLEAIMTRKPTSSVLPKKSMAILRPG